MDSATKTLLNRLTPGLPRMATAEVQQVVLYLEQRHQHYCDGLEMIIKGGSNGNSITIEDPDGDSVTVKAGGEYHAGFVAGIQCALTILGPFPLKLSDPPRGGEGGGA